MGAGIAAAMAAAMGTKTEQELARVKSDLQAVDAAINGTKTAIELTANKGYNAYGKVPGDEFTGGMGDSTGTYCTRIQVLEGEKYKINSNGTGAAFRSYFTRGAGNKIVRISTTAFDGILTINSGEDYLYCTFPNYNPSVSGLWKVSNTLDDKIEEIITEEMQDVASINFGEKVLVSGVKTGEGYNLGGNDVGDTYSASTTANDKTAYLRIPVEPNTSYIITGKSNQYSFKLFAVIDGFNKIIAIENSSNNYRDTPKVVNPPAGAAYIIVNFWDYDATKDKLEKIHNETLGRLFDTIDEPLKGKTILLLGDSVLGNDRLCGVAECLKEITGATVINGAIGGTRLCGDTRGSGDYVPFDGENLVEAITTGVWTEQDAHASGVVDYVASETLPALKAMDLDDVDIVIFNWMTNDYTNNTTKAKYKTAYQNVVEMLLTANPKLRLLSVTMYWFYTADGGTDVTQSYTMGTGFDAADCTIEAAHENHVPVIDMYRDSPICDLTKAVYLDSDKVHPNNYGNKMYAGMLWGKIKTLMQMEQ